MSPLENRKDGRNVHVLIQVEDGKQYVVLDSHFIKDGVRHAHLKWREKSEKPAAARAMRMLSSKIRSKDYEVYNARALTPEPNYFAVWFATREQFEVCAAQWTDSVILASEVEDLTPRKQSALKRICYKASLQHAERLQAAT